MGLKGMAIGVCAMFLRKEAKEGSGLEIVSALFFLFFFFFSRCMGIDRLFFSFLLLVTYEPKYLELGMLKGNEFLITLR